MEKILVAQIIAHYIADFYLLPKSIWKGKRNNIIRSWHIYVHTLIVFFTSAVLTPAYDFILYAALIATSHYVIDSLLEYSEHLLLAYRVKQNNSTENENKERCKFSEFFFSDQLLHMLSIYIFVRLYCANGGSTPVYFNTLSLRIMLIVCCIIFCLKPTSIYIKNYLRGLRLTSPKEESSITMESGVGLDRAGREIGYIERTVTLLLVLLGQYTAIGFILTAKSVLRYANIQFKKTEYVLTGTLFSFGIAIIVGILLEEGVWEYIIHYISI